MEQSLWKAVPHFLRRVSNALKKVCCHLMVVSSNESEKLVGYLAVKFLYVVLTVLFFFSPLAHRKVTSINLHTNKIWVLDGG